MAKRKLKAGRGKQKGSAFEREICRALSRFIDPTSTDTFFWRSAMSGGRATIQQRKGIKNLTQLGDLTCIHEKGQWFTDMFVVECKHVANLDLVGSMFSGKGKLAKFWQKHCQISRDSHRAPLLIAKQNRVDILVVFDEVGTMKLETVTGKQVPVIATTRMLNGEQAFICKFEDVFPIREA